MRDHGFITLDFETYYSKEYSLSKMTTEEYLRDPRFQVIGVGVKVNAEPTEWFEGPLEAAERLREIDWSRSGLLAQNTMFDAGILSWHYNIRPKVLFDTMGMSRAIYGVHVSHSLKAIAQRLGLGQKGEEVVLAMGLRYEDFDKEQLARYGLYCINDVDLTHAAFQKMLPGFPKSELQLIDLTLRMFTEPVLELDVPALEAHLARTLAAKEALLEGAGADKSNIMSNDKFAELLRQFGVEPPTKISAKTGKVAYAFAKTDQGLRALAEHEDPQVQALVAARLGNKSTLEETRTQRFIDIGKRGRLAVPLRYYGAHTGRWSGCLVADTMVSVYDPLLGAVEKRIVDVMRDDLVWDGEEFVEHDGVAFSGFAEVVSWDGIEGTADHVVYTDAGPLSLRDAMQGGYNIQVPRRPDSDDVDAARQRACHDQV
jgi:hypothetical protein